MNNKTALVVDDSRIARKLLLRALPDGWGAEIIEASNGREAKEILETRVIDIMFLDLTMPDMDGYSVLEWLREQDLSPIIFVVSGDLQPKAGARVMMMGAFEFVAKPVTSEKIHSVLELAGVL